MHCGYNIAMKNCLAGDKMSSSRKKVIISGMLGNGLEWYDYALYGHMTVVFSQLFFTTDPTSDGSLALILTYLTFAAGFISRPLGAVLFGRIGDKYGRKKALTASMILMAIPTGAIGLLPSYASIGIAAPILLLLIRIIQGLSLGGAFSGSMSYVVEHADPAARARTGSFTMLSLVLGFLLGSLVSTTVASSMPHEEFMSYGWRLPFFVGVLIGLVGFWIRNHGDESPVYIEAKESGALAENPVREVFTVYLRKTLQGFAFYLFVTIPFYMIAIYMIGYSQKHLGFSASDSLQMNSLAMVAMFIPIWFSSRAADTYGRRLVLMAVILAMMVAVYPCFNMMQGGTFWQVAAAQMILAAILGAYIAPIPALLVELFPTRIRYTGMSLAYNFCAILGGFTPTIAEMMITTTKQPMSIIVLLYLAGAGSFAALLGYRDNWREKLA
jgi:MHS family proline/betaine transporter-like MFS transporter